MPYERRQHIRKRVDLPTSIELGGETIQAHVSDMSPGGAFIDTDQSPPFGAVVQMDIQFPTGNVQLSATVRWSKPGGFGVQFGALGAKATYTITEFLADHEAIPDSRRF